MLQAPLARVCDFVQTETVVGAVIRKAEEAYADFKDSPRAGWGGEEDRGELLRGAQNSVVHERVVALIPGGAKLYASERDAAEHPAAVEAGALIEPIQGLVQREPEAVARDTFHQRKFTNYL